MKPEEENEKAKWRQQKFLQFREELQKNDVLSKFLENVYPDTREGFISDYARAKVRWIEYGPNHLNWLLKQDLKWVENATTRLKEIQQKKLFDVQCQWRAEKIQLQEIKVTQDFYFWEGNIFNCPFIEPVTQTELDMYIQYLQTSNFENSQGFMERWQDYDEIKEAYQSENENRNFPEWYDFYNGRTGASVYMLLPDIRGEKEEFYLNLWRKELHQKTARNKKEEEEIKEIISHAGITLSEETDRRPFLNTHSSGWLTWFINTFEDKQTQEVFERYGGERSFDDFDEFLQDDLDLLATAEETVPINAWFDWKEAIHRTAEQYTKEKIIEALPIAYEQYRMNVDLRIGFELNALNTMDKSYSKALLRGRELNGEPLNFDF